MKTMNTTTNAVEIRLNAEMSRKIDDYAALASETLVIRTYDERGTSDDTRREATPEEKRVLSALIAGGLRQIWYNGGKCASEIAGALEFAAQPLILDGNTYDNIYIPMWKFCERNGVTWYA